MKRLMLIAIEPRLTNECVSGDGYWLHRVGTNLWLDLRLEGDNRPLAPNNVMEYMSDFPQEYYRVKMIEGNKAKVLPLDSEDLPWA